MVSASAVPENISATGTACGIKGPHPGLETPAHKPDRQGRTAHASPAAAALLWCDKCANSSPDVPGSKPPLWQSPPSRDLPEPRAVRTETPAVLRPSAFPPADRRPRIAL